jgi:hypothetical protein
MFYAVEKKVKNFNWTFIDYFMPVFEIKINQLYNGLGITPVC